MVRSEWGKQNGNFRLIQLSHYAERIKAPIAKPVPVRIDPPARCSSITNPPAVDLHEEIATAP